METMGEELIEHEYAKAFAEGRARERADLVLRILAARGVRMDEGSRKLLLACTDLDILDQWFEWALGALRLPDLMPGG